MSTVLASGHVLIGAQVAPALAGMAKVNAGMEATAKNAASSSKKIAAAWKPAALALGSLVFGTFKAVQAAAGFESSLNTLQAATGSTAAQMKKVSKAAIALGADTKLPGTSARDAADAMTQLAKGGFTAQQAMEAARGTLLLSAAAGIDNAQAATIQSDALNGFALSAGSATKVSDLLAAASNASTAEITDMAQALAQSSAVAHQANYSISDTVTALSLLANAGIKGSDAGTSLKTMLLRLQAPIGSGAAAVKDLGLNLRDSSGEMKKLPALAQEFTAKTQGMTKAQRDAAFAAIFGSDAIRAANVLLGQGAAAFGKMSEKVNQQGAAQQLAGAKMKGFNGSIEALKSSVETLAIQIGSALLPAATSLVNKMSAVAAWMQRNQTTMGVVATVAASLGTAILIVAGAMKVAAIATAAFNAVMLANPVLLVVAAIAALAVGLVIAYKNSATFRAIVDGAFKAVANSAKVLVAAFNAVLSWVKGNWKTIAVLIAGPFAPLVALATNAFGIRSALTGAFSSMLGTAKSGMQAIVGAVKGAVGAATGAAKSVGKGIVDGVKSGLSAIRSIYSTMWSGISGAISAAAGAALGAAGSIGRAITTGAVNALSGLAGTLRAKAESALRSALSNLNPFSPVEHGAKVYIADPIIQGAVKGLDGLRPALSVTITKAVRDAIVAAKSNAGDLASGLAGMIGTGIDALTGQRSAALGNSPEAQRLRDIEAQQRATSRARERFALDDAITNAETDADRMKAQQDLDDWLLEQERQRLSESLALNEQKIRAEAEVKRTTAERGIADLTSNFQRGLISYDQYMVSLKALIGSTVGDYSSLGVLLGSAFVNGFGDQLTALAATVSNVAKLSTPVGPIIKLPSGPDPLPVKHKRAARGGIIGGAGTADRVPILAAPGEGILSHRGMDNLMSMAMGRGGGGGAVTVNVNLYDRTMTGVDRTQARRLADAIAPELNRRVSLAA